MLVAPECPQVVVGWLGGKSGNFPCRSCGLCGQLPGGLGVVFSSLGSLAQFPPLSISGWCSEMWIRGNCKAS